MIDDLPMDNYMHASALTSSLTLAGNPCAAIPCGFDHTGMPFGLQLVGPMHGDWFTLGVAAALEQLFSSDLDLARPVPDLSRLVDGTHQGSGS